MQAAIVLAAQGSYRAFTTQLELARLGWRDTLMNAGLGTWTGRNVWTRPSGRPQPQIARGKRP